MEVSIAAIFGKVRHCVTFICQENKLIDGLQQSENMTRGVDRKKCRTHCFELNKTLEKLEQ
jgi:hypothetical protein